MACIPFPSLPAPIYRLHAHAWEGMSSGGDASPWPQALPSPWREIQPEHNWSGALKAWAQSKLPDSEHSEAVLAQTMTTGNWKD